MQKLQERKSTLKKATFECDSDANRKEWDKILTLELMSSDESDVADDGKEILLTHKLPWLSDRVNSFKQILDQESMSGKSRQSIRQMKNRIEGSPSTRQQPEPAEKSKYPPWVFT